MEIFYAALLLAWTFFCLYQGVDAGKGHEKKHLNTKALEILYNNRNSSDEASREMMRFFYDELFKDENK